MAETLVESTTEAPQPASEEPTSLKRRQSEVSEQEQEQEQESKRQRISPGKNSPTAVPVEDAVQQETTTIAPEEAARAPAREAARRKASIADEKQRSKRLFGAFLGNLSQPAGDRTSKRRQEIESRRKAELQRQDDERVEITQRQAEKRAEERKKGQERVDEVNMQTRHSNMLNAANFLQTTAEPKLYYRPWQLRSDEEDRIDEQLKEAQAQIDKEFDDFDQGRNRSNGDTRPRRQSPHAVKAAELEQQSPTEKPNSPSSTWKKAEEGEQPAAKSDDSKPAEVPDSEDGANPNTNANNPHVNDVPDDDARADTNNAEKAEDAEEEGDHVVEGDEDTVIY